MNLRIRLGGVGSSASFIAIYIIKLCKVKHILVDRLMDYIPLYIVFGDIISACMYP
jgi:hypothetical protein